MGCESSSVPWTRSASRNRFAASSVSLHGKMRRFPKSSVHSQSLRLGQSWKIAVDSGILSPDEVREEEGWNPGAPKQQKEAA
jgi:hypothetical protein